jgi:protein O-GlcNAc transferase
MNPITVERAMQQAVEHHMAGRLAEAEGMYRQILGRFPDHPDALHLLGVLAGQTGHPDAAIGLIGRAIAVRPDIADYHRNLAESYRRSARWEEEIASLRRALALRPDDAEGHNNLGIALWHKGFLDEAAAEFAAAVRINPEFAEAHIDLGNALWHQGRLDEAVGSFRRAIALRPELAPAHNNLGSVLKDQGRLDEALDSFRRAVDLKPDYATAASNFLCLLHYHPACDAQAILADHRHWARRFAEPLAFEIAPHTNDRTPDRRLKIGFASPDFRAHPVGELLLPFFSHFDHATMESVCYSDVRATDDVTGQLRACSDRWYDTAGMSDQQLAQRIREDRIDILVDLGLHTANNRLLVFARKPAPVQATMLGMPATTGLATMDYRLTDRFLDPPGPGDGDYSEISIRLPHSFWCYQPPPETPEVGPLPALARGFVTFGCLNQFAKVSRPALQLWIEILRALPTARLVIQSPPGSHLDAVRRQFRDGGVAPDRVDFVARASKLEYLRRHHDLDVCLDPFPYNGHTTTLDALWMGVPVITLAGRTAVGRGGVSILSNAGLSGWIAGTPQEYLEIAVRWAGDLAGLGAVRAGLRQQMQSSPVMDGRRFAVDVQSAFRQMWTSWATT